MRITKQRAKRVLAAAAMLCIAVLMSSGGTATATSSVAADAAASYKAKCASCHSADGSGTSAAGKKLNVRDLRSADVQKQTDAQLLAVISKGKEKMPGYEKTLGADTCKALVAHIRTFAAK